MGNASFSVSVVEVGLSTKLPGYGSEADSDCMMMTNKEEGMKLGTFFLCAALHYWPGNDQWENTIHI